MEKQISKPFHNSLWFPTSHVPLSSSTASWRQKLLCLKAHLIQQWHQIISPEHSPELDYSSLKINQQLGLLQEEKTEVLYTLYLTPICTSVASGKGEGSVRVLPVGCRWACQLTSVVAGRGTCCTSKDSSKFCKHCETCPRISNAHKECYDITLVV